MDSGIGSQRLVGVRVSWAGHPSLKKKRGKGLLFLCLNLVIVDLGLVCAFDGKIGVFDKGRSFEL